MVILTKADLCKNVETYISEIEKSVPNTPVYAISAVKSTLVNVLAGKEIMETKSENNDYNYTKD